MYISILHINILYTINKELAKFIISTALVLNIWSEVILTHAMWRLCQVVSWVVPSTVSLPLSRCLPGVSQCAGHGRVFRPVPFWWHPYSGISEGCHCKQLITPMFKMLAYYLTYIKPNKLPFTYSHLSVCHVFCAFLNKEHKLILFCLIVANHRLDNTE